MSGDGPETGVRRGRSTTWTGLRYHNNSRAPEVASPIPHDVRVARPLRDGEALCPACAAPARINRSGALRVHRDLFGHACVNRAWSGSVVHIPAPPVALPPVVQPRRADGDPPPAVDLAPYDRPHPNGTCHDCGRRISGERLYCGTCIAAGHRQ